jgi:formylglycine-generating enzyme required for sulfatase activity
MTPGRATGAISPVGGFAAIGGRATIEYPPLAVTCFVHVLVLVLPGAPQTFGYLNFRYGDPADCFGLYFTWDPTKRQFECHVGRSANGPIYPGASHYLQPGQRVPITVAVNESLAWLLVDKTQVNAPTSAPSDLALHIDADQAAVGIARCELRPWGAADTARFGRAPVRKLACRWCETALRLHVRNQGLGDRPLPSAAAPFAVAATGTAMQWIPPGNFARPNPASPRNEPTQVAISRGFWLSRYEITQGEWLALATRNPSRIGGSPFLPVECVTWDDAAAWCSMLGQAESKAHRLPGGYEYRLPTEAEWEYAARAGAAAEMAVPADQFWHADNSAWRLHEVGEGQPNAWGLYDMHGNASEWCCDGWQDINSTNPILRLTDPFSRNRDPRQTPYLVRGGGWWSPQPECAAGSRQAGHSLPGGRRGVRLALAPVLR